MLVAPPRSRWTAARVGSDGSAPLVETAIAPAHAATRSASRMASSLSLLSSRAKAARKESPAAVSSTTPPGAATASSETTVPRFVTTVAPRPPRVTSTLTSYCSLSARAAATTSSCESRLFRWHSMASSWRFGVSQSTPLAVSSGASVPPASKKTSGTPLALASRATRALTESGISRCSITTSTSAKSGNAFSRLHASLAPASTTLRTEPSGSTSTRPRPVSPSSLLTKQSSRTLSVRSSVRISAASDPSDPQNDALPPSRATHTAWFRPLPPAHRDTDLARTVSPAPGSRSTANVVS
mmetsp:Transcript_15119/g.45800  ORF Transcript_15119/g.45800 Transcript_15119/m.45800 type:complete len:298 (+) Transcript_15119:1610-2503(+)